MSENEVINVDGTVVEQSSEAKTMLSDFFTSFTERFPDSHVAAVLIEDGDAHSFLHGNGGKILSGMNAIAHNLLGAE